MLFDPVLFSQPHDRSYGSLLESVHGHVGWSGYNRGVSH